MLYRQLREFSRLSQTNCQNLNFQFMTANTTTAIQSVANDYQHYDKFVEPDEQIELQNSRLKWYNIAKADEPVLPEIRDLARFFLETESARGNLQDFGELGFVILHRCGADFHFLLVNSWRNGNELWESVYAKIDAGQKDFQPFAFENLHRGTFCVWELAAVWHEQQAWKRFLLSARDVKAKQIYLQDRYHGEA